jgi:hypothetical protein
MTITGTTDSLVRTTTFTVTVTVPGVATGTQAATVDPVNLTTSGSSDWAHWGLNGAPGYDHKATGGVQIGHYTVIGGGSASAFTSNAIKYSWTDGTPTASVSNTTTGVSVSGVNRGFSVTVPADIATRKLIIYVGGEKSTGTLRAHLSDGSAPDVVMSASNPFSVYFPVFTLLYNAGSAGKTLTVTWTMAADNGGGKVTLEAASLAVIPDFKIVAVPSSFGAIQGLQTGTSVSVTRTGGFTGDVALSVLNVPAGATWRTYSLPPAPETTAEIDTGSAAAGKYKLTIVGKSGNLTHGTDVNMSVNLPDTLFGSWLPASGNYNLTSLGVSDWAHWGYNTAIPWFDHKFNVTPWQISDYSHLGTAPINPFTDNTVSYTWTNGTPHTSVTATPTGVSTSWGGFSLTVPADTTTRILSLYVGYSRCTGTLKAHLSDADSYIPEDYSTAVSNTTGPASFAVHKLAYNAGSSGQSMTVTWATDGGGPVILEAATLETIPDFAMTLADSRSQLVRGTSGKPVAITITRTGGFTGYATLSAEDLPNGVTTSYGPNPTTGASSVTFTASESTAAGSYYVTVVGRSGGLVHRAHLWLVIGDRDSLVGTVSPAPASVDLTALGTLAWAHWGTVDASTIDIKDDGDFRLDEYFRPIGTGAPERFGSNGVKFSWTNGWHNNVYNAVTDTRTGLYVNTVGSGFYFLVPGGSVVRTLYVYVGGYKSTGTFTAHIAGGTSPDYTATVSNANGVYYPVFKLTYDAGLGNLQVTWKMTGAPAPGIGNITLESAALVNGSS